jgi:hypothetical protein
MPRLLNAFKYDSKCRLAINEEVILINGSGLKIQDSGSGGASDANTTSSISICTGGGLANNRGELIELDHVPTRIALVAGLVRRIGG